MAIAPVTISLRKLNLERTQLPLILSWASTIHKVQGLTLEHVVMSLSTKCFATAMGYVGLSRATAVTGIAILELDVWTLKPFRVDPKVAAEYKRLRALNGAAPSADSELIVNEPPKKRLKSNAAAPPPPPQAATRVAHAPHGRKRPADAASDPQAKRPRSQLSLGGERKDIEMEDPQHVPEPAPMWGLNDCGPVTTSEIVKCHFRRSATAGKLLQAEPRLRQLQKVFQLQAAGQFEEARVHLYGHMNSAADGLPRGGRVISYQLGYFAESDYLHEDILGLRGYAGTNRPLADYCLRINVHCLNAGCRLHGTVRSIEVTNLGPSAITNYLLREARHAAVGLSLGAANDVKIDLHTVLQKNTRFGGVVNEAPQPDGKGEAKSKAFYWGDTCPSCQQSSELPLSAENAPALLWFVFPGDSFRKRFVLRRQLRSATRADGDWSYELCAVLYHTPGTQDSSAHYLADLVYRGDFAVWHRYDSYHDKVPFAFYVGTGPKIDDIPNNGNAYALCFERQPRGVAPEAPPDANGASHNAVNPLRA